MTLSIGWIINLIRFARFDDTLEQGKILIAEFLLENTGQKNRLMKSARARRGIIHSKLISNLAVTNYNSFRCLHG